MKLIFRVKTFIYSRAIFFVSLFLFFIPLIADAMETPGSSSISGDTAPDLNESENGSWLGNAVFQGLSYVFFAIFKLIGYMFYFVMKILDFVISGVLFEKIFFSPESLVVLNSSWGAVRDFLNLFFILILVFVAISIILNVGKFNDKKLIFRVIISALLVNFSKAISMVIIDISQLVMTFFAQAITFTQGRFVNVFLDKIKIAQVTTGLSFEDGLSFFVVLLMSSFFLICLTIVIGILTLALVIRLVAFWVLIVLSPAAMFGLALPGTAIGGITKNWFDKMISWAFFGPIMMFFLWLSLVVISAVSSASDSLSMFNVSTGGVSPASKSMLSGLLTMLVPYISALYLMYYGFDQSRKMSQGAAQGVMNFGAGKLKSFGKFTGGAALGGTLGTLGTAATLGRYNFTTKAAREGSSEKFRESRMGKTGMGKFLTKKGREARHEEQVAKFSGEKGQAKYQEKKISEASGEIKEKDDTQLNTIVNDTNEKEHVRIAAARKLVKDKKVNSAATYGNVESLLGRVKSKTSREGLETGLKKNLVGKYLHGKSDATKKAASLAEIGGMSPKDLLKLDKKLFNDSDVLNHLHTKYNNSGAPGSDRMQKLYANGSMNEDVATVFRTKGILV